MKKDMTELPADIQAQMRALEALPDDQVDTTDAPEILDWSDARRGVFHRPVKQQITLRLDADIIAWFKAHARDGRGYQTDINEALREHVKRTTRSASQSDRQSWLRSVKNDAVACSDRRRSGSPGTQRSTDRSVVPVRVQSARVNVIRRTGVTVSVST